MLDVIEKTINYWNKVIKGEIPDSGKIYFPLCHAFWHDSTCYGCPVEEETGMWRCCGTPYEEWILHNRRIHNNKSTERYIECDECKDIALKYKVFLKYILRKQLYEQNKQTN